MIRRINTPSVFKLLTLLVLMSMVSCIPQKKLRYLQEVENSQVDTTRSDTLDQNYHLKANDEVYIQVNSLDPKTYAFFNGAEARYNQLNNDVSVYLNSHTITDSGYIQLPVIGKIEIAGLTMDDARAEVENKLKEYLTEVSVVLKLSGFRVTLIGEVKRPGRYTPYVSRLNIFEALALSGDMTSYGNRERVMIIRKDEGKEHVYILNMLDANIVHSEFFHLLPNDIIYVESLNAKTWGFEQFPYVLILSTVTTFIALMSLIRTI
jgi:polysaccharide export outer membrane protein